MRILTQNKKPIFYAKYLGQTEVLEDGLHTGDYEPSFGDVGFAYVYISVPRNNAEVERNGVVTPYRKTIISETDLGLKETDIFSYGLAEIDGEVASDSYGEMNPWNPTEAGNGGAFNPWTPEGLTQYKVVRVAESRHHTTYLVEEL